MSEKEKAFLRNFSQLPPELQEKMSTQLDGAMMAMDYLEKKKEAHE